MTFSISARGNTKSEAQADLRAKVVTHPSTPRDGTIERAAALMIESFPEGALSFSAHGHHESVTSTGPLANLSISVCRAAHVPIVS